MKTIVIVCLALGAAWAAPGQEQGSPTGTTRDYELKVLDPRIGEALIWELCPAEADLQCQVLQVHGRTVRLRAPLEIHRRVVTLLATRDALPAPRTIQLHLLTARRGDARMPPGLAAGPRRAAEDLAAVLGYGQFALLDTAVVRTDEAARVNLSGPHGAIVEAIFRLRTTVGLEGERILVEELNLVSRGAAAQPSDGGHPAVRPGSLLSTSLSLDVGETVVVGTSRFDGGDEALVLLLTALP